MLSASCMVGTFRQQHARASVPENKSRPPDGAENTSKRPTVFSLMRLKPKTPNFLAASSATATWATSEDSKLHYEKQLPHSITSPTIRLLRLLPGDPPDQLRCAFVYTSLAEAPPYKAVSYVWGSTAARVKITIGTQTCSIGLNLASALQSFRLPQAAVLLWADALCINQEDNDEKTSQISLMGQIYAQASAVNIWLGHDTRDHKCNQAFELFKTLGRVRDSDAGDFDLVGSMIDGTCQEYGLPRLNDPYWSCLRDLLSQPWFGRLWVVQEATLATRAVLHCGSATLDWDVFCAGFLYLTANAFWYRPDYLPDVPAYIRTVQLATTYTRIKSSSPVSNLLSLLDRHRLTQAHDPRDKIYRLLGLLPRPAHGKTSIVPDYSRNVGNVYIETAAALIQQCTTLDILGIPKATQKSQVGALPSWAPDWSASNLADSLTFRTVEYEPYFNYDAAKTASLPKHAIIDGSTLLLRGHMLDCVSETGMVFDPFVGQDDSSNLRLRICTVMVHRTQVFDGWRRIASSRNFVEYRPTGEPFDEAFEKTLVLGHPSNPNYVKRVAQQSRTWRATLTRRYNHVLLSTGLALPLAEFCDARSWRIYMANEAYAGEDDAAARILRCAYRNFVWTDRGYIGLGPQDVACGDRVFLVQGSKVPLVFRPHGDEWTLIGDCYIHGIMDGEAFDETQLETMRVV